jgi:hypothetical protein
MVMVRLPSSKSKSPQLVYTNNKGKQILVGITYHARKRFLERWERVYPKVPLTDSTVDQTIADCFTRAKRVENFGRKMRTRINRYGKDTLYFQHDQFTFVVQDASLVTVEISNSAKRHLNKCSTMQQRIDDCKPEVTPVSAPDPNIDPARNELAKKPNVNVSAPSFRLTGIALFEDGNSKSVNLGTHEALTSNAEPEQLAAQPGIVELLRIRLQEKCPGAELHAVFIALGKKQEKTFLWRI